MSRSFETVRAAAAGRWPEILPALGIPAEALTRRHGPCPGCGGRDRFRFDDRDGTGSWFCNGGGDVRHGDGFDLLVHALGLTKGDALKAVADHLGIERTAADVVALQAARTAKQRREVEAALLHELYVLLQVLQARADGRQLASGGRFRAAMPESMLEPEGRAERERQAVRRIKKGLSYLYETRNEHP